MVERRQWWRAVQVRTIISGGVVVVVNKCIANVAVEHDEEINGEIEMLRLVMVVLER